MRAKTLWIEDLYEHALRPALDEAGHHGGMLIWNDFGLHSILIPPHSLSVGDVVGVVEPPQVTRTSTTSVEAVALLDLVLREHIGSDTRERITEFLDRYRRELASLPKQEWQDPRDVGKPCPICNDTDYDYLGRPCRYRPHHLNTKGTL